MGETDLRQADTDGRVVVGVDDSPGGREALRYAAAVARWQGWTLHIIHTWHQSYPAAPYSLDAGVLVKALEDAAQDLEEKVEAEVLGPEPDLDVRRTVAEGSPARLLVAASEGADLLVVGSRGRGALSSVALGSVGQSCVHHAHCPVLIVRHGAHEDTP